MNTDRMVGRSTIRRGLGASERARVGRDGFVRQSSRVESREVVGRVDVARRNGVDIDERHSRRISRHQRTSPDVSRDRLDFAEYGTCK
jgi:hypothetical protein